MSKRLLLPIALLTLATGVVAQNPSASSPAPTSPATATPLPGTRPLTQGDLLRTLDGLGDPVQAVPRSANDNPPKPGETAAGTPVAGAKKTNQTEITAREASFDQKTHQAIFTTDVVVVNPEFRLTCEKLTAHIRGEAVPAVEAAPGVTPAPGASPSPASPAPKATGSPRANGSPRPTGKSGGPAAGARSGKKPGGSAGGLERAIAEGNVVIIQDKVDNDGAVTHNVGRGRRAVYDAGTGDITLTGRPEVSQGPNTCIATDDSTVIILNRDGRMRVNGPHKTVIQDTSSADPANGR